MANLFRDGFLRELCRLRRHRREAYRLRRFQGACPHCHFREACRLRRHRREAYRLHHFQEACRPGSKAYRGDLSVAKADWSTVAAGLAAEVASVQACLEAGHPKEALAD